MEISSVTTSTSSSWNLSGIVFGKSFGNSFGIFSSNSFESLPKFLRYILEDVFQQLLCELLRKFLLKLPRQLHWIFFGNSFRKSFCNSYWKYIGNLANSMETPSAFRLGIFQTVFGKLLRGALWQFLRVLL